MEHRFEKLREKILRASEVTKRASNYHVLDDRNMTLFVVHDEELAHMIIALKDLLANPEGTRDEAARKFLSSFFPETTPAK